MADNIVGKKYNHWTVLALIESEDRDKKVECICDCGTRRIVSKKNIVSGSSSSCGCSRKQSSHSSRIKNADTRGELLVEQALIAAGGSLMRFDNKGKAVSSSLEGEFIFTKQVRIDDYNTWFTFDFVVYADKMIVIEYDGGFHFKPVLLKQDKLSEFVGRHESDLRKDEYCERVGIPLLRIRYDQEEKIEELIKDVLLNPNKYVENHNYEGSKYYDEWENSFKKLVREGTV